MPEMRRACFRIDAHEENSLDLRAHLHPRSSGVSGPEGGGIRNDSNLTLTKYTVGASSRGRLRL